MNNAVHEISAYLCVKSADAAMDFYRRAFGAIEQFRLAGPDGHVAHAEVRLGDNVVMLAEEFPEMGIVAPDPEAGISVSLHLRVDDADAMFATAVAAGASVEQAMEDQFYGERAGTVRDPFGYRWMIHHLIEDVSVEEMQDRFSKLFSGE